MTQVTNTWKRSEMQIRRNQGRVDGNLVELYLSKTVVNQSRVDRTHQTNHTPFLVRWKSVDLPAMINVCSVSHQRIVGLI